MNRAVDRRSPQPAAAEPTANEPEAGRTKTERIQPAQRAAPRFRHAATIGSRSKRSPYRRTLQLWQRSYAALGAPTDALDYAATSETELRDTRIAAARYPDDQALYWAEAGILPLGSPERDRAEAELRTAAGLATELEARRAPRRHPHRA